MNGGQIIAKILKKHRIQFLFTLCGGHISPIFVGAEEEGIRVIDTRHEANAVFAADAVGRLTGTVGVATVTAGPGVTNTVTALKNAALAQSPLILFGGAAATILKGRGSLQDIEQLSVLKSVCKWTTTIKQVKDIVPTVEKAFWMAQEGVPGPVFVECPIDVLYESDLVRSWYGAKSKEVPPKNIQERLMQWYINFHADHLFSDIDKIDFNSPIQDITYPHHSEFHIEKALSMLKKAQKPLFIIGSGAMIQAHKAHELASAVQKIGIPTYLSGMARGLLGIDAPLQMIHKRREAIKNADLIILAGVPNDFRLDYGNHIGGRQFISINRSATDLYKNKRPTLAVNGDPLDFIIALSNHYHHNDDAWLDMLKELNQQREDDIKKRAQAKVSGGLNPLELFKALDIELDDNTILVADGGDFVATASYILRPRKPLSWLDPGVYGTLGVGAGFALGAKLVYPEKNVWIIYGDGSAGYSLMEYDTFKRHQLPVISVIGNDACWTQISRDQIEFLNSNCAMNLAHSDYQYIAKAFGGDGIRVENIEDFKKSIHLAKESANKGIPYIINAIIGKTDFRKGSISM